ncbi:Ras- protein Rab-37 [Phytophthora pseudosyringae]|uniref:Ras- protein Rab-37 n=1 Tax=Phytophthora pseudosyringae TaxID=221518 RepID=A0A8T1VE77_9STRA|nr:Ras- protein Rab-37 [Phytophthora pseudosyringae]
MPSNSKNKRCKVYKVIVLGDSGVGKSSLVRRMAGSDSLSVEDGVFKDYLSKMATIEGAPAPLKVQLWHTAGQEKFGAARLPSSFFRHADAALVVYDVTDRQSFVGVLRWVLQIQAYRAAADSAFSITLVGHKCDVSDSIRQVREDEGRKLVKLIAASHFFECSSKSGTNVQACFDAVATALASGSSWMLSSTSLTFVNVDLRQPADSAAQTRGRFRLAAPSSGLDVSSPTPDSASIAARSPTLRALSAKPRLPIVGTPYIGTLAVLLSMPMVLLWLDDDALLQWAEAVGIQ